MSDLVFTVDVDAQSGIQAINEFFSTVDKGAKAAGEKLRKSLGDEEIQKKVIITLENGKVVAKEIDTISTTSDKILKTQKALNGQYGTTQSEVSASLGFLKQLKSTTDKYHTGTKYVTADWKLVNTRIAEAQNVMKGLNSTTTSFGGMVKNAMSGLVGKITAANLASNALTGTLKLVGQALTFLFQEGLQFETLNLQLEGFTGSAAAAQTAMDSFLQTAIQTPLDVKQVAQAGKTLMAFGLDTETATNATRQLAVVAGATGGQMDNLARNLGQISAQGRAYTRDLNQFAVQGIPIYSQLATVMNTSVENIRAMAEEGSIGFPEVQQALSNMTREGSAFAEIADRMNNTFTGKIEEMVSSLQLLAGEVTAAVYNLDQAFGSPLTNMMGLASSAMQFLANNMDNITLAIRAAVVAGGAFAAIWVSFNLKAAALGLVSLVQALGPVVPAFIGAAKAAWAFLASMGPAGWAQIALGVGIFTATIVAMKEQMDIGETETRELGDSVNELTSNALDPTKPTNWGQAIGEMATEVDAADQKVADLKAKQEGLNLVGANSEKVNRKLAEAIEQQRIAREALNKAMNNEYTETEVGKINKLILAEQNLIKEYEDKLSKKGGLLEQQADVLGALEAEKTKSEELEKVVESFFNKKIAGQKEVLDDLKNKLDQEKSAYQSAKSAAISRHEEEIAAIESKHNKAIDAINAEISALREKGPAEKALEQYRLAALRQKREAGGLTREETLELNAQIERMERQGMIEEADKRLKAAKLKLEKEKTTAMEKHKKLLNSMLTAHEDQKDAIDKLITAQKSLIKSTEDEKQERISALKEARNGANDQLRTLGEIDDAIDDNISKIEQTGRAYQQVTGRVNEMRQAIQNAKNDIVVLMRQLAAAQSKARQLANTNPQNRFSGGPVTGGQKYTVNELGKEAFLSASGKLSMINAPSWGSWKAPGAGTVIPAHLTSQLDIPKGGIDLNRSMSSSPANTAGGGSLRSISAALGALAQGGGTVNNHVTIQAANTTQAASDMLVEMSRIKRRR